MSHVKVILSNTVFIETFYGYCFQSQFLSESCGIAPNMSF